MAEKRARRNYSEEFKKQMIQLYNAGKPRAEIIREYDLTSTAFDRWVKRINKTGSTKGCDNRAPEQEDLIKLRKENTQLKMSWSSIFVTPLSNLV